MFDFFKDKFENFKAALKNTSAVFSELDEHTTEDKFSDFALDDIEDLLISADLGVDLSSEIVDELRNKKIRPSEIKSFLKEKFLNLLKKAGSNNLNYIENSLNIYFITGVNGAGKTTLIGKLAYKFKQEGKKVLIAAGDTFRAAAEEQLDIWSKRAGADIVRKDKIDPAAIVYETIQKAKSENYDVILIDTAGRLQNKFNLMEELSKIKTVIDKNAPEALRESIIVIDANTGQNGLQQAKIFKDSTGITAVALTKLDGSAKGAIILRIAKELNLPVKLVGVGEKIEDLRIFNPEDYINILLEK